MPKTTLDEDAQRRLHAVLAHAGNDLRKVVEGVRKALQGVHERARYKYLYHVLQRKARARIRAEQKKDKKKAASIPPGSFLDAFRHQRSLMQDIPAHDQ